MTRSAALASSLIAIEAPAKAASRSNARARSRHSRYSGQEASARRPCASMVPMAMTAAGSLKGGVAMLMAVTAPATATAPPMPMARAATTASEKRGSPARRRPATTRSRPQASSHGRPAWPRCASTTPIHAAEVAAGRQPRLLGREAAGLVRRGQRVEMRRDLLGQPGVARIGRRTSPTTLATATRRRDMAIPGRAADRPWPRCAPTGPVRRSTAAGRWRSGCRSGPGGCSRWRPNCS